MYFASYYKYGFPRLIFGFVQALGQYTVGKSEYKKTNQVFIAP